MSESEPVSSARSEPGWRFVDRDGTERWWDGEAWGAYKAATPAQQYAPIELKSEAHAYQLAFAFGGFGAHHFYLGRRVAGVSLFILWCVGLSTLPFRFGAFLLFAWLMWWLLDIGLMRRYVQRANRRLQRSRL
jgi:hypothetical protein